MDCNLNNKTPLKYNSRLSNLYKSNIFFKEENMSIGQSYKYRLINNIINNNYKEIVIVCYNLHISLFSNFLNKYFDNIYIYSPKSIVKNKNKYKNIKIIDNDYSINKTINKAISFSNEKNIKLINTISEKNEDYYNIFKEIFRQIDNRLHIDYIIISGCHNDLVLSTLEYFKNYKNTKVILGKLNQQKKIINTNYSFPNKKELYNYNNYEIININEDEYIGIGPKEGLQVIDEGTEYGEMPQGTEDDDGDWGNDLYEMGDMFYIWQYKIRWAATSLRQDKVLLPADECASGTWALRS